MSARQAIFVGIIIALVCAGVVWYLEEFQRRKIVSGVAQEWTRFVNDLPDQQRGNR